MINFVILEPTCFSEQDGRQGSVTSGACWFLRNWRLRISRKGSEELQKWRSELGWGGCSILGVCTSQRDWQRREKSLSSSFCFLEKCREQELLAGRNAYQMAGSGNS